MKDFFEFEINAISKSKLPIGTLLMNLSFPGQEVENIIIYVVDTEITAPISPYPQDLATQYNATLESDISENSYFNRNILKENIKINLDFNNDVKIINEYGFVSTAKDLNQFFYEVRSKNVATVFEYANTLVVEQSGR